MITKKMRKASRFYNDVIKPDKRRAYQLNKMQALKEGRNKMYSRQKV